MTGLNKISGQYSVSALNRKKASGGVYNGFGFNSASSESSDEASFSSFSVQLAKINAELKNTPDVREDVVAKFKEQIDNGTYNPPLDKVAHALIMAGMLDNIN
ncbi:MAG: flagellar biosynthesis anti-sigma factor FlgM [Synergistaceae bacterium]|nr:flagellar biosynthesis anti-sigma factor FlgM [Synergistaceae bacterium]MBQ9897612.1 flagellar biosynthesis anti-sigma factor FlgM [Synergistaceae bacterium]MBR0096309.1 flagellar biosynthesis anti-sigma factor FlgM [Synergistaceae bacterium]MBR0220779.1 flagellar biosynthesis anti-sigma factor FlgM [Synergistaceae bacterium]